MDKSSAVVLATAWLPAGEMDLKDWVHAGRRFGMVSRCSQWWIGDWIRFGNAKWGEKYIEAARITGYDVGSLRNMASVASQIDPSLRSDKLSYSHHVLLTSLPDAAKREWIERAIRDRLSVADLRIELRSHRSSDELRGADKAGAKERGSSGGFDDDGPTVICPHCGGQVPSEPSVAADAGERESVHAVLEQQE